MRLFIGIAAAVLLSACATAPDTSTTSLASSDAKATSDTVCRRIAVIGSNMDKKVCLSNDQWAAYDDQGRESVEVFDRNKESFNSPGRNGAFFFN